MRGGPTARNHAREQQGRTGGRVEVGAAGEQDEPGDRPHSVLIDVAARAPHPLQNAQTGQYRSRMRLMPPAVPDHPAATTSHRPWATGC